MWEVLYCLLSMFTMRKYIVSLGGKRYIALNEIKHVISASSTIAFKVTFMVSTDFFYFIFLFFIGRGQNVWKDKESLPPLSTEGIEAKFLLMAFIFKQNSHKNKRHHFNFYFMVYIYKLISKSFTI